MLSAKVLVGDNRQTLKSIPDNSVQTVVTSPPYWGLRDYGHDNQIGLEAKPDAFIEELCQVFDEVWRVLKDDGTIWVNLGDTYSAQRWSGSGAGQPMNKNKDGHRDINPEKESGLPDKNLVGIPWKFAFAMQARGWYLRQDIIWHKPNPMPESVTDRCTKSHEYIFLMSKNPKYFYNHEAIKVPVKNDWGTRDRSNGKYHNEGTGLQPHSGLEKSYETANKRSVWSVPTSRYKDAHFATYPPELITPCILAGSKEGDIVLDPFSGSGTTGEVALQNNRNYVGLELNPEYAKLSEKRLVEAVGMLGSVSIE